MDITNRFNQLCIIVILIVISACARVCFAVDCYYGKTTNNMKDLHELSAFSKKVEVDTPYVELHYNGYSVSKERYEELMKREKTNDDPNMRLP